MASWQLYQLSTMVLRSLWVTKALVVLPSCLLGGPRAQHAWQAAGSPDPYFPGNIVNNTTRYMGIALIFHPRKNQTAKVFVACVCTLWRTGINQSRHHYQVLWNHWNPSTSTSATYFKHHSYKTFYYLWNDRAPPPPTAWSYVHASASWPTCYWCWCIPTTKQHHIWPSCYPP